MKNVFTPKRIVALLLVLMTGLLMPAAVTPADAAKNGVAVPVTGSTSNGGSFVGSFDLQRFAVQNGQIVAVGTLTGTVRDAAGGVLGNVARTAALPLNTAATLASCDILHLELGPLDLDLLGLVVHLDRVVLDISAQPGAGNLLGNLLCAVANLLNGGGALNQIVNLLNQILDIISGV